MCDDRGMLGFAAIIGALAGNVVSDDAFQAPNFDHHTYLLLT